MSKLIEYTATLPSGNLYAFKNTSEKEAAGYVSRNFPTGTTFKKDDFQQGEWISHNGYEGEFENMKRS